MKLFMKSGFLAIGMTFGVWAGAIAYAHAQTTLTLVGGGATGSWTRSLTAMAECVRQQETNLNPTAVPTSGGMDAFRQLSQARGDIGFAFQSVLDQHSSEGNQELRVIGVAEGSSAYHVVVSQGSGIARLEDLSGKRFAPGPVGTVSHGVVTNLLEGVGVYDEIEVANVSHSEMVSYLNDGKIDGWALQAGIPSPAATQAAVSGDIVLLDLGPYLDEFITRKPHFFPYEIPAGTYPGIDEPVTTFAEAAVLVAHKDVPDDLVYTFTKTIWGEECVEYLTSNVRSLAPLKANPLEGISFPLHPGAAKYWSETGRAIPEAIAP